MDGVRFPAQALIFLFANTSKSALKPIRLRLDCFFGANQQQGKLISSAESKNACIFLPISPTGLHHLVTTFRHRDNSTRLIASPETEKNHNFPLAELTKNGVCWLLVTFSFLTMNIFLVYENVLRRPCT